MGYHQLTQVERYAIARMRTMRKSVREIARNLGRSAGTISRELQRNKCKHDGGYRAEKAHSRALTRRSASRKNSQYSQQEWAVIEALVRRKWSPKQIQGRRRLKKQRAISAETIYRRIRKQRSAGGDLWRSLRAPPRQNSCRPNRTDKQGAMMRERVGSIRTSIQGQSGGEAAAAGKRGGGSRCA